MTGVSTPQRNPMAAASLPSRTAASGNSSQESAADQAAKKANLDYKSFLKLMVEQMKNQDPTSPMKTSEYMGQLASFSAVEQAVATNKHLESVKKLLTDANLSAINRSQMASAANRYLSVITASTSIGEASSLIGREITSADGGTTGIVRAITLTATGIEADLTNGESIRVRAGVEVAAPGSSGASAAASPAGGGTAAGQTPTAQPGAGTSASAGAASSPAAGGAAAGQTPTAQPVSTS